MAEWWRLVRLTPLGGATGSLSLSTDLARPSPPSNFWLLMQWNKSIKCLYEKFTNVYLGMDTR